MQEGYPLRLVVTAALLVFASIAAWPAGAADINARLAAADPDRGELIFRKCAACHSVAYGGDARIGPNLWSVLGAPVGAKDRFRYSDAMAAHGGHWTLERLDAFLAGPRAVVKGTVMQFEGLGDERDRADLIAFLNRMSDRPVDFGAAPAKPMRSIELAEHGIGLLVAGPGAAETHAACTACHSERIVIQQGLPQRQWDKLLDLMVDEHEMTPLRGGLRQIVLDYLSQHYGPDRPNYPPR